MSSKSFLRALLLAGLVIELTYLALRGFTLGRLPLVGPHDTLVFFSTAIVLMAVPFLLAPPLRKAELFSWLVGFTAALFTLLALPFPSFTMPLPPVLKTFWFELHVALAFFAYALFAIGALLGALGMDPVVERLVHLREPVVRAAVDGDRQPAARFQQRPQGAQQLALQRRQRLLHHAHDIRHAARRSAAAAEDRMLLSR
jgi:hypothetical protein